MRVGPLEPPPLCKAARATRLIALPVLPPWGLALLAAPAWAADDLRPLKPAVGPNLWLPALLALLVVALLVAVLARMARRPDRANAGASEMLAPPPPPASLRARLEQVRDSGWIESGAHVKACDVIAEVMRDLARARWIVSTPRLTTAELLGELAARGAENAITGPLGDVLEACDFVKFAGARVPDSDLRSHLETAFVLVDSYGVAGLNAALASATGAPEPLREAEPAA
ncbi:MAG: hypothetical protein FJZ01_04025 [Candidatus Sericytochromatia bacterium]|nr:hypothetical protein [Candidatus Tanganyikabacteria bacterium]